MSEKIEVEDPLKYELQKIKNAQNASMVVRQGERVIGLMAEKLANKTSIASNDQKHDIGFIHGEVLMFLIIAKHFVLGLNNHDCKPFLLSPENINDCHRLRNVWEHRGELDILNSEIADILKWKTLDWYLEKFGRGSSEAMKVSHFTGHTIIGEYVHVEKIIREAKEWQTLVY